MSLRPDGAPVPAGVTHVMVGFGAALLPDLDRLLPPGSLLIVEEPDVVAARGLLPRAAEHPCVAVLITAPIHDEDDLSAMLAAVPRPPAVRAVLPGVEYGVSGAAALADAWGLPGAGPAAARILRDKALLREAADRAGIPQPRWKRVAGPEEVREFRSGTPDGRCVLKPANRQGSLGVQLLDAADDLDEAWKRTVGADEPRLRARRLLPTTFLAEERLDGREVSVECVVSDGRTLFLNITEKLVQGGRHPVEAGHQVPAHLLPAAPERIADVMEQLVEATGFRTGVLHAEWILRDGEHPQLVECAGRVPGDCIHELVDLAHGGSLVADFLTVLGGSDAVTRRTPRRHAAIRFLDCPPGTVESVDGTEHAGAVPGVIKVHIGVGPGAYVGTVSNSHERVGYVVATGESADQVTTRVERAAASVRFRLDADGSGGPAAARTGTPGHDSTGRSTGRHGGGERS
ncbi:ATP-grasp domain-containing protein [Streptomyces virginiae]|uniref:ATP-grasp domain-containing protein n=1 Tax=Streptomyces virginiae TaxID=1961 RepID=UPI00225BF670|nr:ATP-grasp domain-containing protein [Streptomyces virginiae]MCX4721168.1 ATP-grasp domain-containing protein [Streptomyces virginiae]MCX5275680.1 ATP-grasp domain-containing protein [Streptomyces virginiae]